MQMIRNIRSWSAWANVYPGLIKEMRESEFTP